MEIDQLFREDLKRFTTAPFLFIGSGFSRRYIGLEDWPNMLKRFCVDEIEAFDYYFSMANAELPQVASLIAEDFLKVWWKNARYEESRKEYNSHGIMNNRASPLKYEISKYLSSKNLEELISADEELQHFKKVVVDGIITTNWDRLLEEVFSDYQVFIGQKDLINSNVQEIGEIYKIHGCISDFNSLILTSNDYEEFNNRNPYLAAKLLTIFMEHPIIFLGYSISDSNIQEILDSIVYCLSDTGLDRLHDKLFFVEPIFDDSPDVYEKTYINIEGSNIPITSIKVKDYSKIYIPMTEYQRKISVKHIKQIKAQLYEIVKSNDPQGRMALIDINDATNFDNIDFVIGVGISEGLKEQGYLGVDYDEILEDILLDNKDYDPITMVETALPTILKHQHYTPFYKYLCTGEYIDENGDIIKDIPNKIQINMGKIESELEGVTVSRLVERGHIEYDYTLNANLLRATIKSGHIDTVDISTLEEVLIQNIHILQETGNGTEKSNLRTLIRIYDWLKYFKKL